MNHKMRVYAALMGTNPVEDPPESSLQALGYMMQGWLQNAVVDGGTSVDIGMGMGEVDLWVTVEGKQYYIRISEKQ